MTRLLEEHEYMMQSYWAQRLGEGQGGEHMGSKGVKRRISLRRSSGLEASKTKMREVSQQDGRRRRTKKIPSSGCKNE